MKPKSKQKKTYRCADARHTGKGRAKFEGGYCAVCRNRQMMEDDLYPRKSEKGKGA